MNIFKSPTEKAQAEVDRLRIRLVEAQAAVDSAEKTNAEHRRELQAAIAEDRNAEAAEKKIAAQAAALNVATVRAVELDRRP